MASFTGVGDNTTLSVAEKGEDVTIALSGTYNMTIVFQREVGSPGSGAWETLRTYTTANATVSEVHRTEKHNEELRLLVTVDTSGTCTATLTDTSDKTVRDFKDLAGNSILELRQSGAYFKGVVAQPAPISITANVTLTQKDHAGRALVFNSADGDTVTLPAATGTGDIYIFVIGTTVTSNNDIIQVANATDIIQGVIVMATDTGGITVPAGSADDTITMNGTTKGGVIGGLIVLQDAASGLWAILAGQLPTSGAEATPFSAAVS